VIPTLAQQYAEQVEQNASDDQEAFNVAAWLAASSTSPSSISSTSRREKPRPARFGAAGRGCLRHKGRPPRQPDAKVNGACEGSVDTLNGEEAWH